MEGDNMTQLNSFGAAATLRSGSAGYRIFRLDALEKRGFTGVARLPFSIKVLLENLLRFENGERVTAADVEAVASGKAGAKEISFMPARVLLQDFTGVPCAVDLAAMRDALAALGADPGKANPLLPADLVIDHSVQVDQFGTAGAFGANALLEYQRNRERYSFLRWAQTAFEDFRVVPPDTGIVHQVNLEYLAPVVFRNSKGDAYPDTLVGTDSHTTMINGLGVVGWGVGGIEAEAARDPAFPDVIELDLGSVVPSMAGPKRPQDRLNLSDVKKNFIQMMAGAPAKTVDIQLNNGAHPSIGHGSVAIAAITSCTNT